MNADEFRRHGHALIEWVAEYLTQTERYPVLSRVAPGDVRGALPDRAPEHGEPFDAVVADFERVIVPAITHWNHPGFFAYFPSSTGGAGVLAELLAAAINQQAMLWRTSPAATELEEVALGWLRDLMGLPAAFDGVIYDTASIATVHALAAARQAAIPGVREQGLAGRSLGPPRVYASEHAHSSVEKSVILLGLGQAALQRIDTDEEFRLRPDALERAIVEDLDAGARPVAIVATAGTTSTTSVDPLEPAAAIAQRYGLWLHVDAAYAGAAAIVADRRHLFAGWEQADSIVVNPHKWLFTPFDLSAFYCRRMDVVRQAFSLVPEYLQTAEGAGGVRNLMDTGVQLGRRFRALKLWMILRTVGAEGLRAVLVEHMRLARLFADWIDDDPDFERLAPVPFSVVCFRARPAGTSASAAELDDLNRRLLDAVNATGDVFLSHTRLDGALVLRLAIGHLRTTEVHVARAWEILRAQRHILTS